MKTALVTGGARGIGAEISRALANDGFRVVVNYNTSRQAAEKLASELGGIAVCADVADGSAVLEMFSVAGGVDALVTNAAAAQYGLFQDTAPDWTRLFAVNFGGVVNCVRAALPYMLREKSGSIVAVTSVWGESGASCESIYASSKAAVAGLIKSLAAELAPSNIRANCVSPGIINAGMTAEKFNSREMEQMRSRIPLGRLGTAGDIAAAAAFLCSERAAYITGQVISVNGGII